MIKTLSILIVTLMLSVITVPPIQAGNPDIFEDCPTGVTGAGASRVCSNRDSGSIFESGSVLRNGLQIFIFAVGFASLAMVTIGGFKYVISRGDPQELVSARNTVLYAIIGLVIALSAQGILTFVIDRA